MFKKKVFNFFFLHISCLFFQVWFQNRRTKWRKRHAADMAKAKKRQNVELSEKIHDDVSRQQESLMTSHPAESFSPNKMQEKRFYYESGSTKESDELVNSDTTSNDSSQTFHVNYQGGLSVAINNSQSNSFNPTNNLILGAYRQQKVQNNQLGVAMVGGGESKFQGFS